MKLRHQWQTSFLFKFKCSGNSLEFSRLLILLCPANYCFPILDGHFVLSINLDQVQDLIWTIPIFFTHAIKALSPRRSQILKNEDDNKHNKKCIFRRRVQQCTITSFHILDTCVGLYWILGVVGPLNESTQGIRVKIVILISPHIF